MPFIAVCLSIRGDLTGSNRRDDCTACVAGKYLNIPGLTSQTYCIECDAGRYVAVGGSDNSTDVRRPTNPTVLRYFHDLAEACVCV